MRIPIFQVDAFTEKLFSGNPAAVVFTKDELPPQAMQSIASENNLSETAFVYGSLESPSIRWFTPTVEVDLCGHATLAAAHIVFTTYLPEKTIVTFSSKSGDLPVSRAEGLLWLDFPVDPVQPANDFVHSVREALDYEADQVFRGRSDLMAVLRDEEAVLVLRPRMDLVKRLDCRGLIATARGRDTDFVSRFFAPQSGVPEDPVTGSAHTTLTPYWSSVLGKQELRACQLSARRGLLKCRTAGARVHIGGKAITYLEGEIGVNLGI
jgi:PhzF family phenazine biosynthesis protein